MNRGANLFLQKTVFFALFVGYVLFVVSFFIPRWYKFTKRETGQHYNYGIFMACILDSDGGSRCQYTHFDNVEGGIIVPLKALASIGLIFYTAAMATGFLALCWINEKRQRLFYASVGTSLVAGIFIILVVAIYKSQPSYSAGSDDIAFYLAAISIAPLFYAAAMGILVARTMVFVDEKEDEEKMHQERRKKRRRKRKLEQPAFMFPPTGTMFDDFKKKPVTGIVVASDDFEMSPDEDPFFFKQLTVKREAYDKYETKSQDREVAELSVNQEQYDVNPNLDEREASLTNYNIHNPSTEMSESAETPRLYTPSDVQDDITPVPWCVEQAANPRAKGPSVKKVHVFDPIKISDLLKKTRAYRKSKKASTKKIKKGRSNSAFSTDEHEPHAVDVHGHSMLSHKFEDLPEVEK
ncbi:uncharacterized protein LOC133194260 [Saccostrea echinata]|uniref:uncharacterized protein LOC133194260 n=1 Tax=Saccostrea echinata TaxID=191078 RepID=UPI002A829FF5|nr:uncharacterized protein LOC133194260 [Saccostrea echinata]